MLPPQFTGRLPQFGQRGSARTRPVDVQATQHKILVFVEQFGDYGHFAAFAFNADLDHIAVLFDDLDTHGLRILCGHGGYRLHLRASSCFIGSHFPFSRLLATDCWMKNIPSTPSQTLG
jgi:hypothetical protein